MADNQIMVRLSTSECNHKTDMTGEKNGHIAAMVTNQGYSVKFGQLSSIGPSQATQIFGAHLWFPGEKIENSGKNKNAGSWPLETGRRLK